MELSDAYSIYAENERESSAFFLISAQTALIRYKELSSDPQWRSVRVEDAKGKPIDEVDLRRRAAQGAITVERKLLGIRPPPHVVRGIFPR